MSFIDQVTSRVTLANKHAGKSSAVAQSIDRKTSTTARISKEKIRDICIQDSLSFNMLNVYTNLIMKPGYEFTGTTKDFDRWFKNMRKYGDNTSLRRLYKELHRDRGQYGAAYMEFIPYENGKGIADLRRVNASRIDYARDGRNNIILDKKGIPFGFVMKFGVGAEVTGKGDQVTKEMERLGFLLKVGEIFLRKKRIAIFPLYRLDNNFEVLGLVEPAYNDTVARLRVTKAQVDAISVKATSLPILKVGDPAHEPTPQMMNDADYIIKNLREATGLAVPYHMNFETLEYKSLDIIENTVKMLLFSSAAASGTPLALITGAGEETNRSTLAKQLEMTIGMLQSQVQDFVEDWNLLVMDRIKEENGFSGDAQLRWKGIRYEDKEEEFKAVLDSLKLKAISVKEFRAWLSENFDIKLTDKAFEKVMAEQELENPVAKQESTKTETSKVKPEDKKQKKPEDVTKQ